MKKLGLISITLIITVLLITGLSINFSLQHKNADIKGVNVTGSAKRDFESDIIVWSATYSTKNMILKDAYEKLDKDKDIIKKYLLKNNIPTEDILFNSIYLKETYKNITDKDGIRTNEFDGYYLSQSISVESKFVKEIEMLSRDITRLIDSGVEIQSGAAYYFYSKLEDLKIDLIAEATQNAEQRAVKIAENSNNNLGNLINAQMGVFQIVAKNSTERYTWGGTHNKTSKNKTANVTMKLSYEIGG